VFILWKANFFMKMFKSMSSLVTMVKDVMFDIGFFLLYYLILVLSFSYSFFVLSTDTNYFDYFLMVFKLSNGEVNFDEYQEEGSFVRFVGHMIWISCVLLLTVIMMAFLVAVVTRSYERWTMKSEAQTYRQKAQMILERESIMTEDDFVRPEYFPTHILVRKPKTINSSESSED
jgi:hypothetical protein